jgi:hypothetical protein
LHIRVVTATDKTVKYDKLARFQGSSVRACGGNAADSFGSGYAWGWEGQATKLTVHHELQRGLNAAYDDTDDRVAGYSLWDRDILDGEGLADA